MNKTFYSTVLNSIRLTVLGASLLASIGTASAVFVTNVAFSDVPVSYTGAAAVGGASDTWATWIAGNESAASIGGGVSMEVTGADAAPYYNTGVFFAPYTPILTNYIYSPGTLTLTFTGLNNLLTYDFTAIASLDLYFDGSAKSLSAVGFNTVNGVITNNSSIAPFTSGTNFITLAGITPTAGGQITMTLGADVGLNAVQITTIPEPSTYVLLGLGLASLAILRRKKA